MAMVADITDAVVGVDTHRDTHEPADRVRCWSTDRAVHSRQRRSRLRRSDHLGGAARTRPSSVVRR